MADKLKLFDEIKARIIAEMEADERYKEFFSQYHENSVKSFIESYARHKANLEAYGDRTKYSQRNLIAAWQQKAWKCLEEIQQKKLFDRMCQWQAEDIPNPPQIQVTYDFITISKHILDYEGIPRVTPEEVKFYQEYLLAKDNVIELFDHNAYTYQDYREIREHYEQIQATDIEYYDHHNLYTGNHRLLSLPDTRIRKEDVYMQMAIEHSRQKYQQTHPSKTEKPYLSSEDGEMIRFAKLFNDRKTAIYIKDWMKWINEKPGINLEWAVNYLTDVYPEKVPIKAHADWQEAIYDAAIRHIQTKVSELLPLIYEEYLMKKASGVLIAARAGSKKDDPSFDGWYRNLVLEGRELSGEPRDFNF